MSKRKTFDVRELIETVNSRNRASTCGPEVREGWNSLLENALHACGVYEGFRYLSSKEVPSGHLPGIQETEGYGFSFPDETRRVYHLDRFLTAEPKSRLPRDPMGPHGTPWDAAFRRHHLKT